MGPSSTQLVAAAVFFVAACTGGSAQETLTINELRFESGLGLGGIEKKHRIYANYVWQRSVVSIGVNLPRDMPSKMTYFSDSEAQVLSYVSPLTVTFTYILDGDTRVTDHKLCAAEDVNNVQMWVGMKDDWHADTDIQQVGSFDEHGLFVPDMSGDAVKLTVGGAELYLYANFPGTSATKTDAASMLKVPIGDIKADECKTFQSYYKVSNINKEVVAALASAAPEIRLQETMPSSASVLALLGRSQSGAKGSPPEEKEKGDFLAVKFKQ